MTKEVADAFERGVLTKKSQREGVPQTVETRSLNLHSGGTDGTRQRTSYPRSRKGAGGSALT